MSLLKLLIFQKRKKLNFKEEVWSKKILVFKEMFEIKKLGFQHFFFIQNLRYNIFGIIYKNNRKDVKNYKEDDEKLKLKKQSSHN